MPFLPYIPTTTETETEAQIVAITNVTDETLRWIVTIYMAGYHTSASETVQEVKRFVANMAALPDKLIPQELVKRIGDMVYEVLGEIVALEVATAPRPALKPGKRQGDDDDECGGCRRT